jgi:hypothetical protein
MTPETQPRERVAVAYSTAYSDELTVETGTVLDESPYTHRTPSSDEIYVDVDDRDTVLSVPVHGGTVDALHHATKRHDTRQGTLHGLVPTDEVESQICLACHEWLDHLTPVGTRHNATGDSGCPHCHEADPVRSVVHEVGDKRTILGGYDPRRGHGHQVTLDAAASIVDE